MAVANESTVTRCRQPSGTAVSANSGTAVSISVVSIPVLSIPVASVPMVAPREEAVAESSTESSADRPWTTIVWNDPINLMSYVTYVFMEVFSYPRPRAEKLMMDVHTLGRATVSTGTRERMEMDVNTLHGYGLWATLQQDA